MYMSKMLKGLPGLTSTMTDAVALTTGAVVGATGGPEGAGMRFTIRVLVGGGGGGEGGTAKTIGAVGGT